MNSYIVSIRPEWVEKIVNGEKTIEVRKTAPKEVPFKAYIYVTKDKPYLYGDMPIKEFYLDNGGYKGGECNGIKLCNGRVIGEFICNNVHLIKNQGNRFVVANEEQGVTNEIARQSCLDYDDMVNYLGNKDGYGWHISDLKIYDKPKELSEFTRPCSYDGICFSCKRFIANGMPYGFCDSTITRPPQSYMRVEEVEE